MKIIFMNIERVKSIMAEKNIDKKTLSLLSKIPQTVLTKYLGGANQADMKVNLIFDIAAALEVSAKEITFRAALEF